MNRFLLYVGIGIGIESGNGELKFWNFVLVFTKPKLPLVAQSSNWKKKRNKKFKAYGRISFVDFCLM